MLHTSSSLPSTTWVPVNWGMAVHGVAFSLVQPMGTSLPPPSIPAPPSRTTPPSMVWPMQLPTPPVALQPWLSQALGVDQPLDTGLQAATPLSAQIDCVSSQMSGSQVCLAQYMDDGQSSWLRHWKHAPSLVSQTPFSAAHCLAEVHGVWQLPSRHFLPSLQSPSPRQLTQRLLAGSQ